MTDDEDALDSEAPRRVEGALAAGAIIGNRYRIERQVGEGGMASVFLAEDLKHHRPVAVKVLLEALTHTIGIKRLLQEIETIARLQHPHLLTLIDSGDIGGMLYYVMPYIEAKSVREVIDLEKTLSIDRAVAIAREVADGLAYAHEHGVIHRDVKPSNVLMSDGHAVVADFGIATALQKASVERITDTGMSLGSPTYMSPEQAAGERDLDARTDIYSLACMLYEMLSGAPPLADLSMQQMITRKNDRNHPAARGSPPSASCSAGNRDSQGARHQPRRTVPVDARVLDCNRRCCSGSVTSDAPRILVRWCSRSRGRGCRRNVVPSAATGSARDTADWRGKSTGGWR